MKLLGLILFAIVVPGGSLIVLSYFLRRASRQRQAGDAWIAGRITPPKYRWTTADEALPVRTAAKREAADRMRVRAASVESGAPVSALLRRVK